MVVSPVVPVVCCIEKENLAFFVIAVELGDLSVYGNAGKFFSLRRAMSLS